MNTDRAVIPALRLGYCRNEVNSSRMMKITIVVCRTWFNQLKEGDKSKVGVLRTFTLQFWSLTWGTRHPEPWGKRVLYQSPSETRKCRRHSTPRAEPMRKTCSPSGDEFLAVASWAELHSFPTGRLPGRLRSRQFGGAGK